MTCQYMRKRAAVRIEAAAKAPPDPGLGLSGPTVVLPQGEPLELLARRPGGFALIKAHDPRNADAHVFAWVPECSLMDREPDDAPERELVTVGAVKAEGLREMTAGGAS